MTRSSNSEGSGGAAGSDRGRADCATAPAGAARKKTATGTKARFRIARKRAEAPPDWLIDWIRQSTLLLYTALTPNNADRGECATSLPRNPAGGLGFGLAI